MNQHRTLDRTNRFSRRDLLRTMAGLALGTAAMPLLQGCAVTSLFQSQLNVAMAIADSNQTMWRYLLVKRNELFRGKPYQIEFQSYTDEGSLRDAFIKGDTHNLAYLVPPGAEEQVSGNDLPKQPNVIASLVPTVASLAAQGLDLQFFLPIAWIKEGYPLVARQDLVLNNLTDLRRMKVAVYPFGHPGTAFWSAILNAAYQTRLEDLDLNQTFSPHVALANGEADVAMLGSKQWSQVQANTNFTKITDLQTEWKQLTGSSRLLMLGGYMARRSFLDENEQFAKDLARVHIESFQLFRRNRTAILNDVSSERAVPKLSYKESEAIAHYFGYEEIDSRRVLIDDQDIEDYDRMFNMMADVGFLPSRPPDVTQLFRKVRI